MDLRALRIGLAVAVVAMAALHVPLIFLTNINWDEFRFLADIHLFRAGRLSSPLQTFHVHLFAWLAWLPGNEIEQILAARIVYYLLLLASCALVFTIARTFMANHAALFVVLCCLSYSEIIRHGTAFRFDGLAVFLLLLTLAAVVRAGPSRAHLVLAAVPAAVACLITLKSAFFLPTIIVAVALRPTGIGADAVRPGPARGARAADSLAFAASLIATCLALFVLHRWLLGAESTSATRTALQRIGPRVIRFDHLVPSWPWLRISLLDNMVIWLILLDGLILTIRDFLRGLRRQAALLLALLLPIGSLIFYRNGYPYFFVFLMPPALVLCGVRFDRVARGRDQRKALLASAMIAIVLLSGAFHALRRFEDHIAVQRQIINAVHEVFAEPVPYIDRNSMVSTFPKAGFFMSTWAFTSYHERGVPVFRDVLEAAEPRFVLANHVALVLDSSVPMPRADAASRLLPEDLAVLRDNYVHHWGPIFVAGKRALVDDVTAVDIEVLVSGPYTVETSAPVVIDGRQVAPHAVVILERGHHTVQSPLGSQWLTLRWGDRLPRPAAPVPAGRLYTPLWF